MSRVIPTHSLFAPHLLENPRQSPPRPDFYTNSSMAGRKRKADSAEPEDRMSTSPSASPSTSSRTLPNPHQSRSKRLRSQSAAAGRPLDLPRLLETLSPNDLRSLLTQVCDAHPSIAHEIVSTAPRPTLDSTLSVLNKYETALKEAFPFGTRPGSEYAYNRVKAPLAALLDALKDFTPHFLPPHEPQPAVGLAYLDAVTNMLHRIPAWDYAPANRATDEAYEETGLAWAAVLREAEKRGAGFQLQLGGWEAKLARHDQEASGRLGAAVDELRRVLGWAEQRPTASVGLDERRAVRQALLGRTYGPQVGVGGQW